MKVKLLNCHICMMLLVVLTINFMVLCCGRHNDTDWYEGAKKYIYYDNLILEDKLKDSRKNIELLKEREAVKQSLISSSRPSEKELATLLLSTNIEDNKVALICCMFRGGYSIDLYKKVIDLLYRSSDFSVRFYSYNSLNTIAKDKFVELEDKFLRILSKEQVDGLIISAIPILPKINSPKVVDFFVRYLNHDSDFVRLAAQKYMNDLDEKIQKMVSDQAQ